MDRKPIGLFAFGRSPIEHMPPLRTRALLAEAALPGADLLFFARADWEPASKTILATRLSASAAEKVRVPMPSVVLVTDKPAARYSEVDDWLRAETLVIVARGPDKIQQLELLADSPLAPHIIPATVLTADGLDAELAHWLSLHGAVAIKPADGMWGNNVHFIFRTASDWRLHKHDEVIEGEPAEIIAAVRASVARRMRYRKYIVQRYIESTSAGQAVGLRIDVHKQPDGSWALTRAVAMISVTGGLTVNMAGGGAQMLTDKFLPRRTARPASEIYDEAVAIARRTAEMIDRDPAYSIYELGVDLALDPHDQVWVIETNPFPGAKTAEQERAMHTIAYALSLTN